MADPIITYGSYTFPTPSPLVAETSNPIVISGQSDFFLDEVNLVGTLTGANLSGLHVKKMQMVSGLLSEFETLTVTGDNKGKFYSGAKPTSINFSESDLTTILPYSVTFEAYSSGTFSKFFGVVDPQDNWTFSEQDGRVSNVSHVVSARGLNLGNSVSALTNAKNFVSGRITGSNGGYRDISLFQKSTKAFLRSRTETIDNKASSYSITEEYNCSTSDTIINIFNISDGSNEASASSQRVGNNISAHSSGPCDTTASPSTFFGGAGPAGGSFSNRASSSSSSIGAGSSESETAGSCDATRFNMAAFRFENVDIDKGASIDSAKVTFVLKSKDLPAGGMTFALQALDVDDSPALTTANYTSSFGAATTASVSIDENIIDNINVDEEFDLNVKEIVEEIVNRSGWSSGNAITFLLRTTSTVPARQSHGISVGTKGGTDESAVLTIETNNNPSGILESNAQISLDSQGKVSVSINGSLKGSIDANSTGGLLTTGNFTPTQAQELAVNAVASSLSDFESGAYTFSNIGPSSYEYQLNTGSNTLNFTFTFSDSSNTEQSGNILHTKSASVSCSKDDANTKVSINGDLKYHSNSAVINSTGDPTSSQQWLELRREFSGINFFNLAVEALQDFTGNATGYQISGLNLNQTPIESGVNKNPFEGTISYNVSFDNKLDLSNGDLTGLRVSITDTRPIQVSGIKPSIAGFATQNVKERQMGLYAVSATCEGDTGTLPTLANNVNKYITGVFDQAKSESVGENTISFNLSRYY